MTIDETIEYLTDFSKYSPYQEAIDRVSAYIEQMQADYENRLKADMVAILDKIRAEIETKYGQCKLTEYIVQYDGICTGINEIGDIADILQILDKYKAEIEPQKSEDNK